MNSNKLTIKIRFQVLSNMNGVMTVAIFANDSLCHVVAGESYQMLHALEKAFEK